MTYQKLRLKNVRSTRPKPLVHHLDFRQSLALLARIHPPYCYVGKSNLGEDYELVQTPNSL